MTAILYFMLGAFTILLGQFALAAAFISGVQGVADAVGTNVESSLDAFRRLIEMLVTELGD